MKRTCEHCGGTGQLSYFKGYSRFLLSQVDCPECCGTGYVDMNETEPETGGDARNGPDRPQEEPDE
jgi:DnaJ-class molecular chaperone